MTVSWDSTRVPIACEGEIAEDDLWALHRELWTIAFPALGSNYQMDLHGLDEHVTAQPEHPELWFYRGQDEDGLNTVSSEALRYGFPADEFNNPTFVYEVVHHWFRLGLAAAWERAEAAGARLGVTLTLPDIREEVAQTHHLFVRMSEYASVFTKDEGITLFSATGWTPLAESEPAYHDRVRSVAEGQRCRCLPCLRLRPQARAIAERPAWEAAYAEIAREHRGLDRFVALLELRRDAKEDPGRFDWAVLRHASTEGRDAALAEPEAAVERLVPFVQQASGATEPAAVAIAGAFERAKSKPRVALLPALRACLEVDEPSVAKRVVRALVPKRFFGKSPLITKHLDAALLAALRAFPARVAEATEHDEDRDHEQHVDRAVGFAFSALVARKPAEGAQEVVRAWLTSPRAEVRAAVVGKLRLEIGGSYLAPWTKSWVALFLEVAGRDPQPELAPLVLQRREDASEETLTRAIEALEDHTMEFLPEPVFEAAREMASLDGIVAAELRHPERSRHGTASGHLRPDTPEAMAWSLRVLERALQQADAEALLRLAGFVSGTWLPHVATRRLDGVEDARARLRAAGLARAEAIDVDANQVAAAFDEAC